MLRCLMLAGNRDVLFTVRHAPVRVTIISTLAIQGAADTLL